MKKRFSPILGSPITSNQAHALPKPHPPFCELLILGFEGEIRFRVLDLGLRASLARG